MSLIQVGFWNLHFDASLLKQTLDALPLHPFISSFCTFKKGVISLMRIGFYMFVVLDPPIFVDRI
jgi:hypothetical protein